MWGFSAELALLSVNSSFYSRILFFHSGSSKNWIVFSKMPLTLTFCPAFESLDWRVIF